MAQELSDKIRAAAIAKGVDPDLAVSIAQAESSLRPNVGAKTSSAKGLFGIIDKTWSAFGGKPGQQKDADENIRVGMDIISSNTGYLKKRLGRDPQPSEVYAAHFFGPTGAMAFLSADPSTPSESVFSQKVLNANPQLQGKTAQQIRGMLSKKVGGGSTAVASSAPAPSAAAQPNSGIQRAVYKAAPLTHPMLSQLGPSYQAAMAVSMLADEGEKEGKSEYEPSESERMLTEATARPVALAQADLGVQSPFPELQKQPVKMAAGGVPYVPTPTVRASSKQELDKVKSQWDAYNTKAGSYNTELEKYTALVDAYNKGPRTDSFTGVEPVAPTQPTVSAQQYQAIADAAKKDIDRRSMALAVAANPEQFGLSMNKFFAEGGQVDAPYGGQVDAPYGGQVDAPYGGQVDAPYGGEEDPQMMANKTTELQGFTTRQPEGTGTLWGPDVPVSRSAKELKAYTEAMNPAVKTFTGGLGMGTRGYIYADQPDIINLNTALSPGEREVTMLHELEHSMDARGGDIYGRPNFAKMGGMDNNHRAYTLMGNRWDSIEDTVKNMVDNREKLEKFFGRPLDNSYFRKDSYDNLNKVGKTKAMFSEQLASLSALEQTTGKFLTQDPEMRELFPNYKMMAVYDALTGPRQTRMDARDLPPHTPVPSYTYQQNPALRFIQKNLTGENEYGPSYRPLPIKRAGGSPETGEVGYFQDPFGVPDSGPVTSDTLSKGKEFKAADALKAVKEVGTGVARNVKNIARGVTETPYNLVGAPADIGNMALMPFGLDSKEPALGSAHLKRLALERGIRPAPPTDPRDAGFYMMGELGASLVNPAGVVRSGVKATGKAADLLRDLKKPKEVPQTAPAPAPMAGPTPEVQTELAQLTEQRGLPRNAGQAPDPLMGVRPTLEEAQANVAARQAEQLPPPPAEVAVPPEMLEMPPVAPPMQAGMPVERPFVGRLDSFIDTLTGPVQLGQLKGQLKGKFRDYDLERVERAFPGMDDKTKLTPDQIKQALAGVHSPQKWISETVQPKAGVHHQNTDNVWGAPLGTTNLYLEQAPETLAANDLLKKASQVFGPFMQKPSSIPTPEALAQARALLSEPDILKIVDPELISNLSKSFDKVEKNVGLIKEYSGVIKNVQYGFSNPILYVDEAVASAKYQHQPFFKFSEEALAAEREVLKQKFMAQGKNEQDASFLASGEINANFDLHNKNAQKIASFRVQELAIAEGQKHGIFVDLPDVSLVKWDELNNVTRPMEGNTAFKESVENALEPARVTLHEATKNIKRVMDPEIKKVGDILYQRGNLYEGRHKGVAGKPYPIGFTRFSEHEATIPGMGEVQGRHFHELQSDLSKDMRKAGTTSGSAAKDTKELDSLQAQINKYRDDTFAQFQAFQQEHKNGTLDYAGYMEKQKKARDALENKISPLEQRISVLGSRTRSNASYSLQEPFAGFETNQMVRQQLLMKNAIQSAMRDGKRFATFPGNESDKPQLYVGKVMPNLKQVIKDLGGEKSGLELRQIELPPDKDGRAITATGVVWPPEAAARIMKTGVPFAKGGLVDRLSADTRRYL